MFRTLNSTGQEQRFGSLEEAQAHAAAAGDVVAVERRQEAPFSYEKAGFRWVPVRRPKRQH